MKTLIAEDDPTSRLMLAAVLEKEGYEVVQTTDGRQALASLRGEDAPGIAILDWMMPELDGLDVVHDVREANPGVPPYLIMLTTRDASTDLVTALHAGANDYLTKPFNPAELLARVAVGFRMVNLQNALTARVRDLQRAMEEIKTLRGIVPICAHCKKKFVTTPASGSRSRSMCGITPRRNSVTRSARDAWMSCIPSLERKRSRTICD